MRLLKYAFLLLLITNYAAYAEEGESPLPTGVPPISHGLLVTGSTAQEFKAIIVPELYPYVRSGVFPLELSPRLEYEWMMDDEWRSKPPYLDGRLLTDGKVKEDSSLQRGYPFGDAHTVSEDKGGSFPYKILWTGESYLWAEKYMKSNFSLLSFPNEQEMRVVRGQWQRLYPRALNEKEKSIQLFRERLQVNEPAALSNYSWLTYRFLGVEEDRLWIYSPSLQKLRLVTGSNRSDPYLVSTLTPEDLLTWSSKPELSEVLYKERVVGLVPFPSIHLGELKEEGECTVGRASPEASLPLFNFETRRYGSGAGWVPTSTIFIPRELIRLEIYPRDFYSAYGRQILYVDAESLLPVYKIVFDRGGTPTKLVMTSFGLSASAGDRTRGVVPSFTLTLSLLDKRSDVFIFEGIRYCKELPEGATSELDPGKMSSASSKQEEAPPPTTPSQ